MSLSDFHATVSAPSDDSPVAQPVSVNIRMNWADEMEALDDGDTSQPMGQYVFDRSKLPTAPKSVRQSELDLELIPKKAPFKCFLGNISFEADEEKIRNFFRDEKVMSVHLTVDQGGRSKGSGTVEFEDRDSLIAALNKNETSLNNRPLRITLMEPRGAFGDRGDSRGGGYMQRGGDDGEPLKSDESDWRRAREPEPESAYSGRSMGGSGGGFGDRGQQNDRYGDRQQSGSRYGQSDRGGYGDRRGGAGGGYSDRQQGGGYGDRQQGGSYGDRQEGGGRYGDRQQGGYGGRDGQQQERRQYGGYNRDEQRENRSEGENAWTRSTEPASEAPREQREPQSERPNAWGSRPAAESANNRPAQDSAPPMTERPKLQLQPRTLPVEEKTAPKASGSSIFGSAKPVNTAAREREIEERLKVDTKPDSQDERQPRTHRTSTASEDSQSNNKSQNSVNSPQQNEESKPAGNPWKSRQPSENSDSHSTQPQRNYNNDDRRGGYNKSRNDAQNSHGSGNRGANYNRDGGNRGGDRGGRGGRDNRGGGGSGRDYSDKPYKNYNDPKNVQTNEPQDIGFVNKFAGLEVDEAE